MFGSFNIDPDYALNQSENRLFTINNLNFFSKYLGKFDLQKKAEQQKSSAEDVNEYGLINKRKNAENQDGYAEDFSVKKGDNPQNSLGESNKAAADESQKNENIEDITYYGDVSCVPNSFNALAAALGNSSSKITKLELITYLQTLQSKEEHLDNIVKSQEIAFIKNLIANFEVLSNGTDYITSLDGVNEAQDYRTITKEQVTPPVDIRV